MVSLVEMRRAFKGNIRISESLAGHTAFNIGGPADYLLEPVSKTDARDIVRYLQQNKFPFLVIGDRSNMLVSDRGYQGSAVSLLDGLSYMRSEDTTVIAGSGVRLGLFVDFCVRNSLGGVEHLAGIPGTLGGAIREGLFTLDNRNVLDGVEILKDGELHTINPDDLVHGSDTQIIVEARFMLAPADMGSLMRRRRESLLRRNEAEPLNIANSGRIFKDPRGLSAAVLLDEAGLKGRRHGGAVVAESCANYIVNTGHATAEDVLALIRSMHKTVKKKFNMHLELDVRLVGFEHQALAEVA